MDAIKISKTADSLSQIYFNNESLNEVVFNGDIIWPATTTPEVNPQPDNPGEIDYPSLDDLLD